MGPLHANAIAIVPIDAAPGDFLFVAAAIAHRFEDFSDDLLVWRVFYGSKGGEVPA